TFGILCIVGNSLAIVVLLRTKNTNFSTRQASTWILFNLTLSGVFIGGIWSPVCVIQLLSEHLRKNITIETVRRFLGISLPGAFICFIVCISYDRYLLLKHSNNHNMHMTRRKSIAVIILSWIIPLPVLFLRYLNKALFRFFVVLFILFGFLTVIFAYGFMLRVVCESEKRIKRNYTNAENASPAMLCKPTGKQTSGSQRKRFKDLNKTLRLAKTATVLMTTYLVCHLPLALFLVVQVIKPDLLSPYTTQIFLLATECLSQINASLNPGIYFMTCKIYLREVKKLIMSTSTTVYDIRTPQLALGQHNQPPAGRITHVLPAVDVSLPELLALPGTNQNPSPSPRITRFKLSTHK
uniref:G-protein coupled receptors family 1 profile domain-containing protein n=2 Tax=Clytia hemisphaerica TaxID=252671 RepID=A0A7M5XBH7_9CNID